VLVRKEKETKQRRKENGRSMSMKPSFLAERDDVFKCFLSDKSNFNAARRTHTTVADIFILARSISFFLPIVISTYDSLYSVTILASLWSVHVSIPAIVLDA